MSTSPLRTRHHNPRAGFSATPRRGVVSWGSIRVYPTSMDIDRAYKRHRRSAYTGIFIGYAGYYLVRNTLALAIPDVLAEYPQHSKADLGWALTGLSISYGVSKFLMGSVSDRSNPKYFLPLGLLISCAIMAVSVCVIAMYASSGLVIVL